MRNTRLKSRMQKGQLATGTEYYFSARPTTDAKALVLISKKAKRKKPKTVAKATKPPVVTRPLREKARGAANKGSQSSRAKKD